MPFRLPTFNLFCNIGNDDNGFFEWPTEPWLVGPRISHQRCALVFGRRVNAPSQDDAWPSGLPSYLMSLLLPAGTDIRSMQSSDGIADTVEVPEGSGRFYGVASVDDIGRGYANEHRSALLVALLGTWPTPYP